MLALYLTTDEISPSRLPVRRGKKMAAVAVGRLILELIWHILSTGEPYDDLRIRLPAARDRQQRHLVKRLEEIGNHVTLTPAT